MVLVDYRDNINLHREKQEDSYEFEFNHHLSSDSIITCHSPSFTDQHNTRLEGVNVDKDSKLKTAMHQLSVCQERLDKQTNERRGK